MRRKLQEDLFDVELVEKQNDEIQKEKHEKENLEARKKLELKYYPEPKNDNERLMNYQYEYIKNGSEEAWGKLITLSFEVTKKLIWRWMSEHKAGYLDEIDQDEKTSIAVEYVLRRYINNIGYSIKKNFITALNEGVKHAMLYKTKMDRNTTSLDEIFFSENKD